jgi:transcriptional regulator with XRE-family HTH domain
MQVQNKDFLKATIQQRNLSYADVAEMADCHKSMIGQLASGHRTSCTPELAERIARCLGVPRGLLFVERASAVSGSGVSGERIPA